MTGKLTPAFFVAEPGNTHGPLINAKAVDKMKEHVDDAVKRGGKVVEGGKVIEGNFYVSPCNLIQSRGCGSG